MSLARLENPEAYEEEMEKKGLSPSNEDRIKWKSVSEGLEGNKVYGKTSMGCSLDEMIKDLVWEEDMRLSAKEDYQQQQAFPASSPSSSFSPSSFPHTSSSPDPCSRPRPPWKQYESFLQSKSNALSYETPAHIYKPAKSLISAELECLSSVTEGRSTIREIEEKKNNLVEKYHREVFSFQDGNLMLHLFTHCLEKNIEELSLIRGINGNFSASLDHYNILSNFSSPAIVSYIQMSRVNGSLTNKYGNRIIPIEEQMLRIMSTESVHTKTLSKSDQKRLKLKRKHKGKL